MKSLWCPLEVWGPRRGVLSGSDDTEVVKKLWGKTRIYSELEFRSDSVLMLSYETFCFVTNSNSSPSSVILQSAFKFTGQFLLSLFVSLHLLCFSTSVRDSRLEREHLHRLAEIVSHCPRLTKLEYVTFPCLDYFCSSRHTKDFICN